MNKKFLNLLLVAIFVTLSTLVFVVSKETKVAVGSTFVGSDYMATSTRVIGSSLTNLTVIKPGYGALARVTITGANTGIIRFWNATTTNVNLRSGNKASSTILITEIPASASAQTYDFDIEFSDGLIYELVSGNAPTSTIVFR